MPRDLLPPSSLLALPGLYLPAGTVGRGSDHYAFIQSPHACDDLKAVLRAGQWTITEEVAAPVPRADPEAGIPEISPPQWLLLGWASEMAVARLGGDDRSCVAQVWRLVRVPYAASGAIESEGEATQLQLVCMAAGGRAQVMAMYVGADRVAYSVSADVPLELGTHAIGDSTELAMGHSELGIDDLFGSVFSSEMEEEELKGVSFSSFYPADFGWEGHGDVTVTSIEPLTGEIVLDDLRDEAGRQQSLRSGFRCDLPPGQLVRASQANPDDLPSPSPAPAGRLTIDISAGPHAGRHEVQSTAVMCSFNLLGDETWFITYASEGEPVAGELSALTVTVPQAGGRSSAFMLFGEDLDWFDTDRATGEVSDAGDTARLVVSGRDSGADFEIEISCGSVDRLDPS